ncbi:ATP-binding protein [Oceanibacterium hippocampi]|uniref:histidine kinase n=1 Tax=Oceanibacterium hippocampi TaxID=745714 RepID=A0A1Y5TAZ5_9PROT|nr:HAMP domain-containing sensor histidine kinase [Oceanibacterium hippocampi]SLN59854.1 Sensor protein PhoQ [Oceanibacterium hippocampi]
MRSNSLLFRLLLGAAIWSAIALVAGGIALSAIFRERVEDNFEQRLTVLLYGLVAELDVAEDGALDAASPPGEPRFHQVYSGWYWQVDGADGAIARSRSLWDQALAAPSWADGGSGPRRSALDGPDDKALVALSLRITLPAMPDRPLIVTVAGDRAEIDAAAASFQQTLIFSLTALGLGLIVAILLQVRFGLRPLRKLRDGLAAIRDGRAETLDEGVPDEIRPLARELNALLRQNAAVVERARRHVGNLAHALKTPVTVLGNEAAGDRSGLGELVTHQTELIRRQLDHYLARARTAATGGVIGARTEVRPVAEALVRTVERLHRDRDLDISLQGDDLPDFRGEREDFEEMLGNLLDNACKWAGSRVVLSLGTSGGALRIAVADDGPGLDASVLDSAVLRGRRLDESVPGSGLGLSIVKDIAELYGGTLELGTAAQGGLEARLTLPGLPRRNS